MSFAFRLCFCSFPLTFAALKGLELAQVFPQQLNVTPVNTISARLQSHVLITSRHVSVTRMEPRRRVIIPMRLAFFLSFFLAVVTV